MAPLDTQVNGDIGAVRAATDGIGALGDGLARAAAGFGCAVSRSGSLWTGNAGDAFRGRITSAQQAAQLAATATRQVHAAMSVFADRMDQVKAKMKQAKSIASGVGLTVSGHDIEPPTPPAPPPNACYSPSGAAQVAARFHAAVAKYKRQLAAYRLAEEIIAQARHTENQAHTALSRANRDAQNLLTELKDNRYWIAGETLLGTAERGLDQAEKWAARADHYAERFDGLINSLNTLPEGTDARLAQLGSASRTLEDVVDAGHAEDVNKAIAFGMDPRYAKLLSVAGGALSAAEIARDVLRSKDRVRNVAGDVASIGVNVGADEVIG